MTTPLPNAGTVFADVLLPLAVQQTYTYSVPEEMLTQLREGLRVEVQFGRSKHYTGIVRRLHGKDPGYRTKPILSVVDLEPLITPQQVQLWEWMAEYYACTVGEVVNAGLPSHLKLTSETLITLGPLFTEDAEELDDQEYMIVEALTLQHELTLRDIRDILQKKVVYPVIRRLLDRRIIFLKEELQERYKPKVHTCVRFTETYLDPEKQVAAFDLVERSEKQTSVLLEYLQLSRTQPFVRRADLTKRTGASSASVNSMVKKGIFELYEHEVSRITAATDELSAAFELTEQQKGALTQVQGGLTKQRPVLLHGVTGSGKTRVYLELMQETLKRGKQILYLLPEIALTSQLVTRLQKVLGDDIVVYHSRLNNMERVEIWKEVQAGRKSVIGPRSALFLPFKNLDLVVIDEEHDSSYKQHDPAPRYNGRDVGVYLGYLHGAKTILGTATPSLESWENARSGKYTLVSMPHRYGGLQLPEIILADARETDDKGNRHPFLTPTLRQAITNTLGRGEQVILFQNRRGFAPTYFCATCDWTVECVNCDVSLTYHKYQHRLRCHCCGYATGLPEACPACGGIDLKLGGTGTEKIEDELKIFFPDARVARMDLDTTRGKDGMGRIITQFELGELDILVGTQMVTKGLDFEKVGLVGIINADQILRFPDFRADERGYQLMTQVAGRAGRKHRRGKVIIQATDRKHPVLADVLEGDWDRYVQREANNRAAATFPPYVKMIHVQLKHPRRNTVEEAAKLLGGWLAHVLKETVTPPFEPAVARLRTYYLQDIVVRIPNDPTEVKRVKGIVRKAVAQLAKTKGLSGVRVAIDVDPY